MTFEDYERSGWADYDDFAGIVAAILRAAIEADGTIRVQQVVSRAKEADSLRRKLENRSKEQERDLLAVDGIEEEIKDLAGARVVAYTNTDAARFTNSRLLSDTFETSEWKLHHPRRDEEDASALYVSSHVVVAMKADRLALPEYARFAGMRCEVQIQTILDHAWAEMAHDTIYKAPNLDKFGTGALDAIKARMRRIARHYLRPAGHEFAKVTSDFDRLMKGAALFKAETLETIVEAKDNNERDDALEGFIDYVIPHYDDLEAEYPGILDKLRIAVERARQTEDAEIKTPYVTLPARTAVHIVRRVAEIVERYYPLNPDASIDLVFALYVGAQEDEERSRLIAVGERIAKPELGVWREKGPAVQTMVVERIAAMNEEEQQARLSLLVTLLRMVLGSEANGYSRAVAAVTFHRGAVTSSKALAAMRAQAIGLLKSLYRFAPDDEMRWAIFSALDDASKPPHLSGYGPDLVAELMTAAAESMEFQAEQVGAMSFALRVKSDYRVLQQFRINQNLPAELLERDDVPALRTRIEEAIATYRRIADSDEDFAIYKVLVGHQVVLPPAWDEERFGYRETEAYRREQVAQFVEALNEATADQWYGRTLRGAEAETRSAQGFSIFSIFLEQAARLRPDIVLVWLGRLHAPLIPFVPHLLSGLEQSVRADVLAPLIEGWIEAGKCLPQIAWYARLTEIFSAQTLQQTLERAIALDNREAVGTCMGVAARRFAEGHAALIETVFMPGLAHMSAQNDRSWVRSGFYGWLQPEMMAALNETQAQEVLDALLDYEGIDDFAEHIVAAIAGPWPTLVLRFFRRRVTRDETKPRPKNYEAVPYSSGELDEPLGQHPDLVLTEAEAGLADDPRHFEYRMGKLVSVLFPQIDGAFADQLRARIARDREGIAFVLTVLNSYGGAVTIEPIIRDVVLALESGDALLSQAADALERTSVVSGEYGFADLAEARLARLQAWRDEGEPRLQVFAKEQIKRQELRRAAETRSAEADVAARQLEWGEDLTLEPEAEAP